MNNSNNDMWEIIMVWVIVFVIGILVAAFIIVKKPERDEIEKQKKIQRNEWENNMSKDMQQHGIKTVTIFMDIKNSYNITGRGIVWQRVTRAYMNEQKVDLDTLYGKEELVYKHCDNKYYMMVGSGYDMVRYEFGKEVLETSRRFGMKKIGKHIFSQKKNHLKFKNNLPKCWD